MWRIKELIEGEVTLDLATYLHLLSPKTQNIQSQLLVTLLSPNRTSSFTI